MKKVLIYFLGWLSLGLIFVANYFVFNHFLELNYYQWFIRQGSIISIITGLIYFFREEAAGKGEDIGLISDHPFEFLGAHFQVLGLLFLAMGDSIKEVRVTTFHIFIDSLIAYTLIFLLAISMIGWFLILIPCQFLVTFICGAPARIFHTSGSTTSITSTKPSTSEKRSLNLDMKAKPFEFTNALAALFLFVLSQILS